MAIMQFHDHGHYSILNMEGDFVGGDEINELRDKLKEFGKKPENNNLIIDLSKVSYLNSTALGIFLSANAVFEKNSGKLLLCNASPYLANIFAITKLTLIFEIYRSPSDAINSLED